MESLFDLVSSAGLLDILEIEQQVIEPVAEVVEPEVIKPVAVEKKRIRYGSEEYYRWIGKVKDSCVKAAAFIKALVKEPEQQTACPCCGGTGEYVGANYRTRCARCKGKGYMTSQDEKAYATWKSSRDRGLPRMRSDFGAAYNFA